jgi:hypothetical protein
VIELLGRADELLVELHWRLDLRDLAARARDGLAHFDELGEHVAGRHRRLPLRLEHGRLELADRFEQQLGLCRAVATGIFGQEPTPARRGRERVLDRGIIRGKRPARSFRWRRLGTAFGAFRHDGEANVIRGKRGA